MKQEIEQQLREAAESIIRDSSMKITGDTPDQYNEEKESNSEAHNCLIDAVVCAMKSEAAKAYHQQTESVNLDELRNEYLEASDKIVPWAPGNHYYEGKNRGFKQGCDWLLNRLSSYLQPQEQKQSDVVKIQQSNEALEQVLKMMETENMHKSPLYSQVKLTIEKNKSL